MNKDVNQAHQWRELADGFRIITRGTVTVVESIVLAEQGVKHAFCTRRGGVSEGFCGSLNVSAHERDDPAAVSENWRRLSHAFSLSREHVVTLRQVHGTRVVHGGKDPVGYSEPEADGIITALPGRACAIKTADCLPILLYDSRKRAVGAVHAGWRGTAADIAARAVRHFEEFIGSSPSDVIAVLGPAIGPCCYEIDESVATHVKQREANMPALHYRGMGKWTFDLTLANERQLLNAGIRRDAIFSVRLCTSCRKDLFFSYRRDGEKTGRQLNFIVL